MGIYKIRTEFGHQLKWLMGILAFIFIIGGAFMFGSGQFGSGGRNKGDDEVIATVNDMQVTRAELNAAWDMMYQALQQAGVRSTLQVAQARARLIQDLIGARLTLLFAKKLGAPVDDSAVSAKKEEILVERLRAARRAAMGKMSTDEERLDPRNDSAYRSELRKAGISLDDVIKQQEAYIPDASIQQALAQEGIQKALLRKAGTVTPDEVKSSYNVYGLREIVIPTASLPADQLKTRVDKIVNQAKGGADFASLAKQYSQDSSKGSVQTVSYGMRAPEVWDRLSAMKPGEVGNPIATNQAVYIVKMENVSSKLPANFDKKAQEKRRTEILNMRMMAESMKLQQEMGQPAIDVKDPEMRGYWLLSQLRRAPSAAVAKQQMDMAARAFKKAYGDENNPFAPYAGAMLAVILQQQGNKAAAKTVLGRLLEGKDARGTGADLYIMYADLLLSTGDKAAAIKEYQAASESAGPLDGDSHKQLVDKFKKVGRPDLAAVEQRAVDKFNANKKILAAREAANGPKTPQPNAPAGP